MFTYLVSWDIPAADLNLLVLQDPFSELRPTRGTSDMIFFFSHGYVSASNMEATLFSAEQYLALVDVELCISRDQRMGRCC